MLVKAFGDDKRPCGAAGGGVRNRRFGGPLAQRGVVAEEGGQEVVRARGVAKRVAAPR